MADAITLAKEGLEAFNKGDWDHTRGITSSNVVYVEVATGRQTSDIEKFIELAKGWRHAFPDANGTVTNALESGSTAVLEITWTGTHSGDLLTPTGDKIPPTGKKINVTAVQVVEASGGKMTAVRHYFDLMTMLAQLGVLPAPARA
jgi:steroid delta-isomerase-like uncharacterized protein